MHGGPKVRKVVQGSKVRMDVVVVGYIISKVLVWRREDRIQENRVGFEVIADVLQVVMYTWNNSHSILSKNMGQAQ